MIQALYQALQISVSLGKCICIQSIKDTMSDKDLRCHAIQHRSFCSDTLDPTPSDCVLRRQQHSHAKLNCYGYCGEPCTCRANAKLYGSELLQVQQLQHKVTKQIVYETVLV